MRAIYPEDAAFVYMLALNNQWSFRWCITSVLPGIELFASRVWHWTVGRFLLLLPSGEAAGLVVLHNTDGSEDFRTLDIVFADWEFGIRAFGPVSEVCFDYFFGVSRINKIYVDLPDSLHSAVHHRLPDYLHQEGRIKEYYFLNGHYEDRIISSAFFEDWASTRKSGEAMAASQLDRPQ